MFRRDFLKVTGGSLLIPSTTLLPTLEDKSKKHIIDDPDREWSYEYETRRVILQSLANYPNMITVILPDTVSFPTITNTALTPVPNMVLCYRSHLKQVQKIFDLPYAFLAPHTIRVTGDLIYEISYTPINIKGGRCYIHVFEYIHRRKYTRYFAEIFELQAKQLSSKEYSHLFS